MKVLKKGRPQKGWSKELKCTGRGNGGGGCGALLLVSKSDLYCTVSCALHETDYYVTFCCPCCGVETDVDERGPFRATELPSKSEWLKSQK